MPADATAEIQYPPHTARLQFGQERHDRRMRVDPIGAARLGAPTVFPGIDRGPGLRLHHTPPYSGSFAPPIFA